MKRFSFLLFLMMGIGLLPTAAQEALAPPEIPGEVVYIPFPVAVTLDGRLDDWAGVPQVMVTQGTATSPDPAENGSFRFALAADEANLYVSMTSVDQTIVTGQHGTDYWNEDSLEFFLNLSSERYATAYGDGIFQINLNPGDIGNSDPRAITVTGTNSSGAQVQAYLFTTEDGWGFEAAVPLGFAPEHGREIGFQAQANGTSGGDRTVKLIWSNADANDQSWSNPSLFGSGLFYAIGQTAMPQPSEPPADAPAAPPRRISLNQIGYFPDSPKYAMLATSGEARTIWQLKDATSGETVASGMTSAGKYDAASGDNVQSADFSAFTTPGTYTLTIDDVTSAPFSIGGDLYGGLSRDALRYFYLNRSGIDLETEYAGAWARGAGSLSDADVTCYQGTDADGKSWDGCDYRLNAGHGWYDAGDYGKYVVNGGITVWTLLNAYEHHPAYFEDGALNIPESDDGVPDILDEARWEMDFLLGMQVPAGQPLAGMAHHKLHDLTWSGVPSMPAANDPNRFLYPPSTAASLNLAAVAAQCARVWREIDPEFAARCLSAAESAWQAAKNNPVMLAGNTPGAGGGNYDDRNISDEQYWAAAELFITTGKDEYREFVEASPYFDARLLGSGSFSAMNWGTTAALGTISLTTVANDLSADQIAALRGRITQAADFYLTVIEREGYRVSLGQNNFVWGSNADVLNNAILLALAYDFTEDARYLGGVTEALDYLLGRNALAHSFVASYGSNALEHPHHRFWGNQDMYPPPPPGALAGGPNGNPSDPAALDAGVMGLQPAKRYVDLIGSYSTNEVAINWNAPLVWVASYLDNHYAG